MTMRCVLAFYPATDQDAQLAAQMLQQLKGVVDARAGYAAPAVIADTPATTDGVTGTSREIKIDYFTHFTSALTTSQAGKFRNKPTVIEAVRLDWTTWNEVCNFVSKEEFGGGVYLDDQTGEVLPDGQGSNTMGLRINTPDGVRLAKQGDYIIRGAGGEFYACKADVFESTYDPADAPPAVV